MLIEDPEIVESLKRIAARLTNDPALQAELLQESLIHLWRTEHSRPGQTRSWYLQSCRFHLQHCLYSGRSVDSRRHADRDRRIGADGGGEHPALNDYHTDQQLFEIICYRDTVSILKRYLSRHQRLVLNGLAVGRSISEIALASRLSYPTVLKYRRRIADLARKLGIVSSRRNRSARKANRL